MRQRILRDSKQGKGWGHRVTGHRGAFGSGGMSQRWCHMNPGPVQWWGGHRPIWGEVLQAGGAKTQRWKCGHMLEGRWGGGSGPIKAALGRALAVLPRVVGSGCGINHTCVFQGHFGCLWEPDPEGAGWHEWRSQGQLGGHWHGPAWGQKQPQRSQGKWGGPRQGADLGREKEEVSGPTAGLIVGSDTKKGLWGWL